MSGDFRSGWRRFIDQPPSQRARSETARIALRSRRGRKLTGVIGHSARSTAAACSTSWKARASHFSPAASSNSGSASLAHSTMPAGNTVFARLLAPQGLSRYLHVAGYSTFCASDLSLSTATNFANMHAFSAYQSTGMAIFHSSYIIVQKRPNGQRPATRRPQRDVSTAVSPIRTQTEAHQHSSRPVRTIIRASDRGSDPVVHPCWRIGPHSHNVTHVVTLAERLGRYGRGRARSPGCMPGC